MALIHVTSFQHNYHNNQLVLMPNETIGLHSRYYDPPPFLSGLSSDLPTEDSLHRSRVFVIVVGSSYTSHLGIIEDPSARDNYNSLHVNRIHVQKTYDARMIRLLGSFWCSGLLSSKACKQPFSLEKAKRAARVCMMEIPRTGFGLSRGYHGCNSVKGTCIAFNHSPFKGLYTLAGYPICDCTHSNST